MYKVLDLFSGIGGFSLGLERTGGFKTIAFCEIDNYCQRVLHKHWPGVYIHSDIRTLTARQFDGWERPDVLCGGFPCQDVSVANSEGKGLAGDRSGLWSEYARLIRELRPRYVIVENVANLLNRGISGVLGELAESGYDAEWDCIPASAVGAPHRRDRVWIVAYPKSDLRGASGNERHETSHRRGPEVADSAGFRCEGPRVFATQRYQETDGSGQANHALPMRLGSQWEIEPNVGRVADGIPARVDRLRSLGNSIVPQIATWIGQRILDVERGSDG